MTYCAGECKKYRAIKPTKIGRYAAGQKRCNYCQVFVDYEGLSCPCCNRQLRCLPRSRKGKEMYQEQVVKKRVNESNLGHTKDERGNQEDTPKIHITQAYDLK
jgi:hypothetical protein